MQSEWIYIDNAVSSNLWIKRKQKYDTRFYLIRDRSFSPSERFAPRSFSLPGRSRSRPLSLPPAQNCQQKVTSAHHTSLGLIRPPDVSREGLKFYPWIFFFFFFFINPPSSAATQWIGRPSNVFRRFGRKLGFNNSYKDLAHTSPNFHRGVKKCKIWRRLKHHSTLKMQKDIRILKQKCNASMNALCPHQVWWSWVQNAIIRQWISPLTLNLAWRGN